MEELHISIPVEPVACPRPRVTRFGTYYPKSYKDFQKVSKEFLSTLQGYYFTNTEEKVQIIYTFIVSRPKYMKAKKYDSGRINHTKRPDLDNFVKAINDSLQAAGVIKDDSQIYSFSAHKFYDAMGEAPSINLTIKKGWAATHPITTQTEQGKHPYAK